MTSLSTFSGGFACSRLKQSWHNFGKDVQGEEGVRKSPGSVGADLPNSPELRRVGWKPREHTLSRTQTLDQALLALRV